MEINQPPQPTEYEQLPAEAENEESLIDRILIRIGDLVIQNFNFLVFITIVWGLFIVLFFGGIVLVYTVSQRFVEIVAHEQQRQIIQEQHLEHMQSSITDSSKVTVGKIDESEWFSVLSDTAEEFVEDIPQSTAAEKAFPKASTNISHNKQELIIANKIWRVSCGQPGLTLNASYPCPITQIELVPPYLINQDVTASN